MTFSSPVASELAGHAEEEILHAVLAFEPRGARQNASLIVDDRFGHLHRARRRRVVRRAGLEVLHDLGAAVAGAVTIASSFSLT